ncbi:MAG: hypothetical protein JRL30_20290 [Deltaproteobacteria bacterium]|nr:hypothetical protein [Deltaproteobacteria bacterium]
MIINLDLDGVMRDFLGALKKQYKKVYPDHKIKPVNRWGLHEFFPIGEDIYDFIWLEYVKECLFEADIYDGALIMMDQLRDRGHEITILTAQPTLQAKNWTFQWMLDRGVLHRANNVVIIDPNSDMDKGYIKGDLILEDAPHHLNDCMNAGITTVCYDQPWNQGWRQGHRVKTYDEFIEIVDRLSR